MSKVYRSLTEPAFENKKSGNYLSWSLKDRVATIAELK